MVFIYRASFLSANQHSVSNQPISIRYLIRPCPPTEYINCGTHLVPLILTLAIRQTTRPTPNHSFHPRQPIHSPTASACICKFQALTSTVCSINNTAFGVSTFICKVSSFISQAGCLAHSALLVPGVNTFFPFQMATLNFKRILLMLKDAGSIP